MSGRVRLSRLRLALCSDRDAAAAEAERVEWITCALPAGWKVFTFHFFVNWKSRPPSVSDQFLLTRLLDIEPATAAADLKDDEVLNAFFESEAKPEFDALERVLSRYGKHLVAVILPEIKVEEVSGETALWVIKTAENRQTQCLRFSVSQLMRSIQNHSGGPVRIGEKGLTFGTSAIECYLSRTDAAFPGDADGVIVDEIGNITHVIEFKKHTLRGPIKDNLVDRYYPERDGRKFQRLSSLCRTIEAFSGNRAVLVVIYFATQHKSMRVQVISDIGERSIHFERDSGDFSVDGDDDHTIARKIADAIGGYR